MATRRLPSSRAKAPPPPPRSRPVLGKSTDDAETNIQVVSKELSIEAALPQSGLGVVTLPPVRTYPFDIAFGPQADQALIYHEVVAPMLG
ncbi:hypothetical protein B0H14DRAFT_3537130 [Mycena olivaceomarginata]|nr:hypothetical protein B0H14DRAFT_3537130 [Mycena olivaceomarginata]